MPLHQVESLAMCLGCSGEMLETQVFVWSFLISSTYFIYTQELLVVAIPQAM